MSKKNFDNRYSKLESVEQSKKYIKEMHEMAEKNEKRSTIAFAAILTPIALIVILTVFQMVTFTVNLAKDDTTPREVQVVSSGGNSSKEKSDTSGDISSKEDTNTIVTLDNLNDKLSSYLKDNNNREKSLNNAVKLNDGKETGLSTIFIAQILRDNGYEIKDTVINTDRLVTALKEDGWEKISDYNQLKPGDVCFTTNSKSGAPSHTYIFMDWVEEGNTEYAHIVDSQISDYDDTYHERNISILVPKKDKFNFFMRKK